MLDQFILIAGKVGDRNSGIKRSWFWKRFLSPVWQKCKFLLSEDLNASFVSRSHEFFLKNRERVNEISSWLADEESKRTFLKMIDYRSRGKRAGFIHYHGGDNQYFANDFFRFKNNEVFVDCGAYTGDTIDSYLSLHSEYDKIIAFEPDPENFAKLQAKHGLNSKMVLYNTGVSDHNGTVQFSANGNSGSGMITQMDGAGLSVQVCAMDSLGFERVSLIKMDIEGAEFQALQGARETIKMHRPKLAICIYHSNEDMLRLAEYIHELVPEYKLWVRQHHPFQKRETVLYAQIED